MTVESAQFISELDETLPDPNAIAGEGDDHIRMMKSVLENTVPFTEKVTSSAKDLNLLNGLEAYGLTTADLQKLANMYISTSQLNRLAFHINTRMVFYQTTPPTGWVEAVVLAGSGMRVVTSGTTGGTSGNTAGNDLSSTIDLTHTHGDNISFTPGNAGAHSHTGRTMDPVGSRGTAAGPNTSANFPHDHDLIVDSSGSHTHPLTKTGTVLTSSSLAFNFKYTDVIICRPLS